MKEEVIDRPKGLTQDENAFQSSFLFYIQEPRVQTTGKQRQQAQYAGIVGIDTKKAENCRENQF